MGKLSEKNDRFLVNEVLHASNNYLLLRHSDGKACSFNQLPTFSWWHVHEYIGTGYASGKRQIQEQEDVQLNKESQLYSHDGFFLWLFVEAAADDLSLQQHVVRTHVTVFISDCYDLPLFDYNPNLTA